MGSKIWIKKEDKFLVDNYRVMPNKEIAQHLDRSRSSIVQRASRLGIARKFWSEKDNEFLIDNYRIMPIEEITQHLSRSKKSITSQAYKLGITDGYFWGEKEKKFVVDNYGVIPTKEIAQNLGRSRDSVYYQAITLGVCSKLKLWGEKEDKFLIQHHTTMSSKEIGKELGYNQSTVTKACRRLGISCLNYHRLYVDDKVKECGECGKRKLHKYFPKSGDGLSNDCKECKSKKSREAKYGLSNDDFINMLKQQNYTCVMCNTKHTQEKPLCVDHCHKTGIIRELLCSNCNTAIGMFGDSLETAKNAVKYLEKWS